MKRITLIFIFIMCAASLKAQSVYDLYVKFNGKLILDNQKDEAFTIAEQILASTDKLPIKTQTNFYQKVAKLYEDSNEPDKAIIYWEKVLVAEPDYYVAHRAVAYLYLQQSNTLVNKINTSRHDQKLYTTYSGQYKRLVKICINHLERAQACDPDNESLTYIKHLYGQIDDAANLKSLDMRLIEMSKHCVTLLTD